MYDITILLREDKQKETLKSEKTISGEDRKELVEKIPDTVSEMCQETGFKKPLMEYVITRNGTYIDGEIDVKVKVTKNGVTMKIGESVI